MQQLFLLFVFLPCVLAGWYRTVTVPTDAPTKLSTYSPTHSPSEQPSQMTEPLLSIAIIEKNIPTNDTYCTDPADSAALQEWLKSSICALFPEQFPNITNADLNFYDKDGLASRRLDEEKPEDVRRGLGGFEEWCIEFCADPANELTCRIAGCPGFRRRRNVRRMSVQSYNYTEILSNDEKIGDDNDDLDSSHNYTTFFGGRSIPKFEPNSTGCQGSPVPDSCDCDPTTMHFVAYYEII